MAPSLGEHGSAYGYDLVLFDLDGVVYLGAQAVAGAAEAITELVMSQTPVAYVTNNASRSAGEISAHLTALGVPAEPGWVVTAAMAAAQLLAAELAPGSPVLVVGSDSLRGLVSAAGLSPVTDADRRPVAVVQGYAPGVGWAELAEACVAIRAGALWVATNTDATLPSPRGPLPGNGSLVAAVSASLGGRPPDRVVGKPGPLLFTLGGQLRGGSRPLVVGDRLDTDIAGAVAAGLDSLLVLTGVATPAQLLHAPAAQRPTFVGTDLSALSNLENARIMRPESAADLWRVVDARLTCAAAGAAAPGSSSDAALRALARYAFTGGDANAVTPADPIAAAALVTLGLAGRG